ncbi:M48 family metallopeptidase [Luteolibacter marinus]|uniref:M48 family metallopeptidase n=1 Tax=Luteolibacter marinus TaxID=2776705 RepID=UPI00186743EA|nr:M48 family metallopeptidase [Luteolibacter marinus]
MNRENFNSLAPRLEASRRQPGEFMRHAVGWIIIGYISLAGAVLTGLLMLASGAIIAGFNPGPGATVLAVLLAMAGLGLSAFVMACLWVRFDPPAGILLKEADHPELHGIIREIGERAGGVRFDQVILDPELNASAVQNPRLGIFGWYRTYLVIGLPLMESLPLPEFKAVIAHEIAHLSQSDGKTAAWLHRTRETWERIASRASSQPFCPLFRSFFNWFWPQFNAKSYAMVRDHELEADRRAAGWVSTDALASGLKRLAIQSCRADAQFWEPLDRLTESAGEPLPDDVMARYSSFLRKPAEDGQAGIWLAEALARPPEATDSHPTLAARLSHLELAGPVLDELPPEIPEKSSAAELLLSSEVIDRARREFSTGWLEEAQELRARRPPAEPKAPKESCRRAWQRIAALARLDGLEKIQPAVLELLEDKPSHSGALYLRGCYLAQKGAAEACDYLERAAADPTLAARAFETLAGIHAVNGRHDQLGTLRERANRHELELRAALIERNQVSPEASFLPHDLGEEELADLRRALESETSIHRVWVCTKQVRHFYQWRHLVLVLELRGPAARSLSGEGRQRLEDRLLDAWDCDDYTTILVKNEANRGVLQAMRRRIADCEVYRRK